MVKRIYQNRLKQFNSRVRRENPNFESKLDEFFDSIGFSEVNIRAISKSPTLAKTVRDNVWGMIELDQDTVRLLDCPLVQRLRQISQLGFSSYTYPTATHTRFDHSIGVYAASRLFANEIRRSYEKASNSHAPNESKLKPYPITTEEELILSRAAILHDIGHGPFSHVSEKIFKETAERDPNSVSFAGISIGYLLDTFREVYFQIGADNRGFRNVGASGNKSLSEIIATIFITSSRFEKFYRACCSIIGDTAQGDLYDISCLILGDPIEQNNFALPQLLHGAVDVDKVDYMLRDSLQCGINISIDKTRVILNAGFYKVDRSEDPYLSEDESLDGQNIVYVIDKFGGDTYEQMGTSRQSLYSRVYLHPVTRIIEALFEEHVEVLWKSDTRYKEFLSFWNLSESELTIGLSNSEHLPLAQSAHRFSWRNLPKRAAMVLVGSISSVLPESAEHAVMPDARSVLIKERQQSIDVSSMQNFVRSVPAKKLRSYSREIFNTLKQSFNISRPTFSAIAYLPGANPDDSILPKTRLIDKVNQKLVRSEPRIPSYLDAGLIPKSAFIVLSSAEARELVAVAFSILFARWGIQESFQQQLQLVRSGRKPLRAWINFPILDWDSQESLCKVERSRILDYFDGLQTVCPPEPILWMQRHQDRTRQTRSIAERYREYSGAGGWRVTEGSVQAFLRQFPVNLRSEMAAFLASSVRLVDRVTITEQLTRCISSISFPAEINRVALAPLTATSGHQALAFLKNNLPQSVSGKPIELENSLVDALIRSDESTAIVLFDDHSASGTQAQKQLESFLGSAHLEERNIFHSPLEPVLRSTFLKRKIALAFVYFGNDSESRIVNCMKDLHLDCIGVFGAGRLESTSGHGLISGGLRSFLEKVGTGLMCNKSMEFFGGDTLANWNDVISKAKSNALGYDNFEGALVTALNVPSSTYTALWRPGFYDPSGDYKSRDSLTFPWAPLFLRGSQVDRVVFY